MNSFITSCASSVPIRDAKIQYFPNSLIMRARPSVHSTNVLVFNKMKKDESFSYVPIGAHVKSCPSLTACDIPRFVQQINDSMFAQK